MKITAIINTHGNPEVTHDTVESVKHYMTDDILMLVEGSAWDVFNTDDAQVALLKGFNHSYYKAPYRNVALSLLAASQHWPNADWFCYMEYDCLIGSKSFKDDLLVADKSNIWCIGNDFRDNQKEKMPLVEAMLQEKFDEIFYMLGACVFLNSRFMKRATELKFFERFLYYTNDFTNDFFPEYSGWDITEHLLPTLAKHWGGEVQQFARWSKPLNCWADGNYEKYPIRWRPDLEEQECISAAIMHPIKEFGHPVRVSQRLKRLDTCRPNK